jgi:uncharacterized protein (TIGR02266 family)
VEPKRKSERALVSIVARYRSPLIFDYVNERCYDLSHGGMFIKSNNPVNPGTLLKLECLVDEGPDRIQGVARVVWVRRVDRPEGPRGMGVKFIKLEPGSEELVEKIIERAGSIPKEDESAEALRSQETAEPDQEKREAPEPEEKARETFEEETATQTSPESSQEMQESPETAEGEREEAEESPQDPASGRHIDDTPVVEPNIAVAASPTPEQKAIGFPKWAMAICAIALIGLIFISLYDIDESVKSADRANPKQAKEEGQLASSEPVSNSTQVVDKAVDRKKEVAVTNQTSEPKPVEEKNGTQTEESLSSNALQSDRAKTSNGPIQTDLKYLLRVTTSPPGARVYANDQSVTSPGTLELGVVSSPIHVTVRKRNFHSSRVVVERSIFVQKANTMEGRIHLDLEPKPVKPEALQQEESQKKPIDPTETPDRKPPPSDASAIAPVGESQTSETESAAPKDQSESTSDQGQPTETTDETPEPDAPQTPFETATQCIAKGDNACVINALKDKASTETELGLLIETYRSVGDTSNATKYMKRFIEKYPKSNRSDIYRKIVESKP